MLAAHRPAAAALAAVVLSLLAAGCTSDEQAPQLVECPPGHTLDGKRCAPAGGTIEGIAQLADQQAHGGIEVRLLGSSHAAATDDAGAFRLASVPPGTWTVELRAPGYESIRLPPVALAKGETLTLEPQTLVREAPTHVFLRGRVLLEGRDSHEGTTLLLEEAGHLAATAADGSFVLAARPGQRATLQVSHPGYVTWRLENLTPGNRDLQLDEIHLVRPAPTTGSVTGAVRLAGHPAAGVTLFLSGTALAAHSGPDGSFRLDDVPAGLHQLVAAHPGYVTATQALTVAAGEATAAAPIDLVASPDPLAGALAGSARLFGLADHEGIEFLLDGPQPAAATTGPDGAFHFADLPPGRYALTLSHPDFEPAFRGDLFVGAGTLTLPDVVLRRARHLHDGQPTKAQPLGNGDLLVDFAHTTRTQLYRAADDSFTELPGPAVLHAAGEETAHLSIGGAIHLLDRATAQLTPVLPLSAAVVGSAAGHVFYLREPHRLFHVAPGGTTGQLIGRPPCGAEGSWAWAFAPYGDQHLQVTMEGLCDGVPTTFHQLIDRATGQALPAAYRIHPIPGGVLLEVPGTAAGTVGLTWAHFEGLVLTSLGESVSDLFVGERYARWQVRTGPGPWGDVHLLNYALGLTYRLAENARVAHVFAGQEMAFLRYADGGGVSMNFMGGAWDFGRARLEFHPVGARGAWVITQDVWRDLYAIDAPTHTVASGRDALVDSFELVGDIAVWTAANATWAADLAAPFGRSFLCAVQNTPVFPVAERPVLAYACNGIPWSLDLSTGEQALLFGDMPFGFPAALELQACDFSPSGTLGVCSYRVDNGANWHPLTCTAPGSQLCSIAFERNVGPFGVHEGAFTYTGMWSPSEDATLVEHGRRPIAVLFEATPPWGYLPYDSTEGLLSLGDGARYALAWRDGYELARPSHFERRFLGDGELRVFASGNHLLVGRHFVNLLAGTVETLQSQPNLRWFAEDRSAALFYDGRLFLVTAAGITTLASGAVERGEDLYVVDVVGREGTLARFDRSAGALVPLLDRVDVDLLALGDGTVVVRRAREAGLVELVRVDTRSGDSHLLLADARADAPLLRHGDRLLAHGADGELVAVPLDGGQAQPLGPPLASLVATGTDRVTWRATDGALWTETDAGGLPVAESAAVGAVWDLDGHLLFGVDRPQADLPAGLWRVDR